MKLVIELDEIDRHDAEMVVDAVNDRQFVYLEKYLSSDGHHVSLTMKSAEIIDENR